MIIPCIDLMDGKVVQLVQGREKALEADSPAGMLRSSRHFPRFRSSIWMPPWAAARMTIWYAGRLARGGRVGGGVRTVDRARRWSSRARAK